MVNQPFKVCPSCGQRCALNMPHCGRCGHVYRTHVTPPVNQTQMFGISPGVGPRTVDLFEWRVLAFWYWTGAFFSGLVVMFLFEHLSLQALASEIGFVRAAAWGYMAVFAVACASLSFFALKLRRHYAGSDSDRPLLPAVIVMILLILAFFGRGMFMLPKTENTSPPTPEFAGGMPRREDVTPAANVLPSMNVEWLEQQVKPGMTTEQIVEHLGRPNAYHLATPSGLQQNPGYSQMRYNARDGYILLYIEGGIVSKMESYTTVPAR